MTAEYIKTFIKSNGFSMAEIAKRAGITRQALFYRLSRERISIDTLDMIADAMGVSTAAFFSEDAYRREVMIAQYKQEVEHLEKLLQEKERLIRMLLEKHK